MNETWVPAFEFEDAYEVSNMGRCKRIKPAPHTRPGFILKPSEGRRGYLRYGLRNGGPLKLVQAHRLVWQSFNGLITDKLQINHLNGVTGDNRISNLEICTASENNLHAYRVLGRISKGRPSPGEKNPNAKLKECDVLRIYELRKEGLSQQKIADVFGVTQVQISSILRGQSWPNLFKNHKS